MIELKTPDQKGCLEILRVHTKNMVLHDDVNLEQIACEVEGLVGASIAHVCSQVLLWIQEAEAAFARRFLFTTAIDQVKQSVKLPSPIRVNSDPQPSAAPLVPIDDVIKSASSNSTTAASSPDTDGDDCKIENGDVDSMEQVALDWINLGVVTEQVRQTL